MEPQGNMNGNYEQFLVEMDCSMLPVTSMFNASKDNMPIQFMGSQQDQQQFEMQQNALKQQAAAAIKQQQLLQQQQQQQSMQQQQGMQQQSLQQQEAMLHQQQQQQILQNGEWNENGSYFVCGSKFTVPKRYSMIKCIGHGAYGIVCSARDNLTGEKVAIKKISKAFDNIKDTKRTLREIHLLRHFKHENLISIKDILKPPSRPDFEDVYIVSELMDTDLHQIITSTQELTDDHCQYFVYQMLRGLKHMHSANVLHRDLKPSNLLINEDCLLKICDLGLARVEEATHMGFMTEYVATRWYRAPEIILTWNKYSKAIDIWSVGCIFAELLGRKPLFQGKDYLHQIHQIIDIIGVPPEEEISKIPSTQAKQFLRQMEPKNKMPFSLLFKNANPLAVDLLERMLQFDPDKRISVEDALSHPYFKSLHDPQDEPICLHKFNLNFENWDLNRELLKELIYNEMLAYHPEELQQQQAQQVQSNDLFLLLQQQQQHLIQQQHLQQMVPQQHVGGHPQQNHHQQM